MVINTESMVGCKNQIKQATQCMKLGLNDVNRGTKKVGLTHMERGPPKINRLTSHPSNSIHVASPQKRQNTLGEAAPVQKEDTMQQYTQGEAAPVQNKGTAHKRNKIWLLAGLHLSTYACSRFILKHA